ncbi:hypothetical protein J8J19_21235, partial [Mycobacterium tuberculosis]|nr:hypothetical protein [Mycobacterium tuberculosis]
LMGMTRGTGRPHIARAALGAIAVQTVDVRSAMEADAGISVSELRVDGGASQCDLLMQIQADLLGRHRAIIQGVALVPIPYGLCAIAPHDGAQLAFRALKGIGAADLV